MKDLIKAVALEVAEKFFDQEMDADHAALYVEACIAELSKRAEAVAWYDGNKFYANEKSAICGCADMGKLVKVFTFPPIHDIEAIENRVAEACAKACAKEAVQVVINGPEERAYNNAVADCAEAIRSGEWRKYK